MERKNDLKKEEDSKIIGRLPIDEVSKDIHILGGLKSMEENKNQSFSQKRSFEDLFDKSSHDNQPNLF